MHLPKTASRVLFVCLVFAIAAIAQEGHPLTGTWHGEWGPTPAERNHIVLYMKWDTKNIVGMINPGPRAIALKSVTLDGNNWTVHIEAEGKDRSGNLVHVVADGKMENIGSYNRSIAGTWTQGNTKGDFKITRD
jgi:hypothetical protein